MPTSDHDYRPDLDGLDGELTLPVTLTPDEPVPTRRRLPAMLVGLAAAIALLHLTVTRPMTARIDALTVQLHTAQEQLDAVAGSRTDAWRANDLLTALAIQNERLGEAESATARMNELSDAIEAVGRRTELAFGSIDKLELLEDKIAAAAIDVDALLVAVADVRDLHRRIDGLAANAGGRMDAVSTAAENLDALDLLKDRMASQRTTIAEAKATAMASQDLIAEITAAAPRLEPARQSAERMIALAARVETADTAAAESTLDAMDTVAEKMVISRDALLATQTETAESQQWAAEALAASQAELAETLLASQRKMARSLDGLADSQTDTLADLIESSELLATFQDELVGHIGSMQAIRRQLVELSMMEPTFDRVARALQPLVSLSDLRHLSVTEMRVAADAIRRDRGTPPRTIAGRDAEPILPTLMSGEPVRPVMAERPVPEPIDGPVVR